MVVLRWGPGVVRIEVGHYLISIGSSLRPRFKWRMRLPATISTARSSSWERECHIARVLAISFRGTHSMSGRGAIATANSP
jgi:hypothetical protein